MAFRREDIAPDAQAYYVKLGKEYASTDTLAQIDKTLGALGKYGVVVSEHGFFDAQTMMLIDVRDAILGAGILRNDARSDKKSTNAALLDAQAAGKGARFTAHAALTSVRFRLFNQGDKASVNAIDAVLEQTRSAGADAEALTAQLESLKGLVAKAPITAALAERAAPLTATLTTCIDALNIARAAKRRTHGTPAETEYLDLLDGIAVELCRSARKAARAAARATGQSAIAKEFELTELYRSTGRGRNGNGGGGGPTAG